MLKSALLQRLDELVLDFIDDAIADLVLADTTPLRHFKRVVFTLLDPRHVTPRRRAALQKALPRLRWKR